MRHRLPIAPPRTPPLPYPPYLLLVNSLKLRMIGRSLPAQAQFPQIPRDPQDPGLPERLFRDLSQRDALDVLTLDKHCYQVVFGGITGKAVRNRVLVIADEMIAPFEFLVCKKQLLHKCTPQPVEIPRQRNAAYNNCIYEDVEPEIELNNRIREEEHLAKEVQELHRAIGWVPLAALRERRKGLWMIERGGLSWLEDSFMFEKF
ncbi:hypothetical protein RUND412_005738 [Rhizina undulata]